jgi:tRNA A37 threonylcarbamoyladenosine modification protein TsaB
MDAKRREVYLGRFRCQETDPVALSPPVRLPLAQLGGHLTPPLLLTGPGLTAYEDFLASTLPAGFVWAPPEMRYPRAATLARLAQSYLSQGLTVAAAALVPDYLRPAL